MSKRTPLEVVEACWAAIAVAEESSRISGSDRSQEIRALKDRAVIVAHGIGTGHPLMPLIAKERDMAMQEFQPCPGVWQLGVNSLVKGRHHRAVVKVLGLIARGLRPSEALEYLSVATRELPIHWRDQSQLRVFHLCRMAGLEIL